MNSQKCLLLFVPFLMTAQIARAASVDAKERAARMACLTGDYAKGVAILTELFVDTKDPTFIYNSGRCFEQNRRYDDAVGRFQEYLRAGKKLGRDEREDAQKHIADCQDLLAKQDRQPAVAALAPTAPPTPVAPAPTIALTPTVVQQAAPQPASDSGSRLRTAGIVTAAVGGAALVGGVILNLKVNSMASDLQKTNGYTDGNETDRKTFEILGWVGYGVGAACVAAGAVLYVFGLRSNTEGSASVAVAPTFAPGQAGAVLKGAF